MAIYDNDWTNLKIEPWNDDYSNFKKEIDYLKKAKEEMDYIKMFPNHGRDNDHINEILNKIIQESTPTSTRKRGNENHFGEFEDVKQPLTLDPSLDF